MFSIIIPAYNEAENLPILIEEIDKNLSKYNNFEIVIVNDASTDNTINIIKSINHHKIKFINNTKNKGQSFSIHKGIKSAKYNTIITIDANVANALD